MNNTVLIASSERFTPNVGYSEQRKSNMGLNINQKNQSTSGYKISINLKNSASNHL